MGSSLYVIKSELLLIPVGGFVGWEYLILATDVCHHDDELLVLVLEFSGIAVRGAIVAFTSEGQLEALAALAAVRGGHSSECKAVFFATIHRKRNLACASGAGTARADATATVTNGVLASGIAYLGLAAMFGP